MNDEPWRRYGAASRVMQLTGVTYRQLDYWWREGFLGDDGRPAQTSGYDRRFSPAQIQRVGLLATASRSGLDIRAVAHALNEGRCYGVAPAITVLLSDDVSATLRWEAA